jgi:hypothetical protein
MTKCLQCGAPMEVVRVILEGTSTWREQRCKGQDHHVLVTEQRLADPAEYRRIRTKYLRTRSRKEKPCQEANIAPGLARNALPLVRA